MTLHSLSAKASSLLLLQRKVGGRKKYIYSGNIAQAWKFENPVYFSVHLFSSSFHSLNTYKFNKEFSELKQPEEINAMEFSVKVLLAHTYTRPCLYFFPSLAWSFIQLLIARTGSRPPSFFFSFFHCFAPHSARND